MKSPITIDFVNATITVNAAYAKKASNPFSAEYAQIQKVRADYPTFTVRTRSIKKNAAKDSYKGLTYDYMRAYIMSHEKGEDRVNMRNIKLKKVSISKKQIRHIKRKMIPFFLRLLVGKKLIQNYGMNLIAAIIA